MLLGEVESNDHDEGSAKTNYDSPDFQRMLPANGLSTCHQYAFRFLSLSASLFCCPPSVLKLSLSRNELLLASVQCLELIFRM